MGAGQSQPTDTDGDTKEKSPLTYNVQLDDKLVRIGYFEVNQKEGWIKFRLEIVDPLGSAKDYRLFHWYLDEDMIETAQNWRDLGSREFYVGDKLEGLEMDPESGLLSDGQGYVFKEEEGLEGWLQYPSVFKGTYPKLQANVVLTQRRDNRIVLVACVEHWVETEDFVEMKRSGLRTSALSYASISSSVSSVDSGYLASISSGASSDLAAMPLKEYYTRLIIKAHASTVYGMYDLPSLIDGIIKSKELVKPPISYILTEDETALAFRTYFPPSGVVKANIILMSYDSIFLDPMAKGIADNHPLAVYVCDVKGFGYSGGKRGVAESRTAPYNDVRSFVRLVRQNSDLPIFLCTPKCAHEYC